MQNMNYKFGFYLFIRRYSNYMFQKYNSGHLFSENKDKHETTPSITSQRAKNIYTYSKHVTTRYTI